MSEETRTFLMAMRQAWLMQLDALERLLGIEPRTAELRRLSNNDWKGMLAAFGGGMVIPSPLHVWWQRRKAKRGQKC